MTRAALYARVSTRDRGQDPENQLRILREWAAAKGYDGVEYSDTASAADLKRRKAWAQLQRDVMARRVDLVAVVRIDRAFRSTLHWSTTLQSWDERGIGFVAVSQPFETTTPAGRMALGILALAAEFERELVRDRVRDGVARARAAGKHVGRPKIRRRLRALQEALDRTGSLSAAAAELGISRSTARRWLRQLQEVKDE